MNLAAFNREANASTKHQVIKQKFEVFYLLDVCEVAVVKRSSIELLYEWSTKLPECTTRVEATKIEHVVEQCFCFLCCVWNTNLYSAFNDSTNGFHK